MWADRLFARPRKVRTPPQELSKNRIVDRDPKGSLAAEVRQSTFESLPAAASLIDLDILI